MSVLTEFHSYMCRTYCFLCIVVRQLISEVKAKGNEAPSVWRSGYRFPLILTNDFPSRGIPHREDIKILQSFSLYMSAQYNDALCFIYNPHNA